MELALSGLASNFDWKSLVEQLSQVERTPQQRLRAEQTGINQRNNVYGAIKNQLLALQNRVNALKDPELFQTKNGVVGDSAVASVSIATSAAVGKFDVNITQLATASKQVGGANVGSALSPTNDVSALVVSQAGFSTAITAGTFSVNGRQITIGTGDTLQQVFDQISTATGGSVTASYDSTTDKIQLSSAGQVVLGSSTDTSNFLQVSRLSNNGTGTVTSASSVGGVRRTASLARANLTIDPSDGGAGAGEFKINGVSIAFNASTDTINGVLDRINGSSAGVTATYDTLNDRFTLTNQSTGDMGISLEDVTGNFLTATGLLSGTLARGQNLLYTIDGGDTLSSQSNAITEESSGIAGVTLTAAKVGTTTVSVSSDTETIRKAVDDFITEFNKTQSMIDSQTASSTDAKGKVTAGVLANDSEIADIASRLRSIANNQLSSLGTSLKGLNDLGIASNGNDNTLKIADEEVFSSALNGQLNAVRALFSDATTGLATSLDGYLENTVGDEGSLIERQDRMTKQSASIDTQIEDLERIVQANKERLTSSFLAMELASSRSNQQLAFLTQRFGSKGA